MSTTLSKLHVRFIQTQNNFYLTSGTVKNQKVSKETLYIKDSTSFYLIAPANNFKEDEIVTLNFKHANDYLQSLECETNVHTIDKSSDLFDTALLFFNTDTSNIKTIYLLHLKNSSAI